MVDLLLEDVSNKIAKEIESTIDLLQPLLKIVPTANIVDDESLLDLQPGNEDDRYFTAQLSKLWKLESTWRKLQVQKNRSKYQSDIWKQRDKMFAATIELAHTLQTYSEDKREQLVRTHGQVGANERAEISEALVQYLQKLKTIGCRKVLTSVKENETHASEISKLTERCKTLQKEKTSLEKFLKERKIVLERDVSRFTVSHDTLKEALDLAKKAEDEEQSKLDEIHNLNVNAKRSEHNQSILLLQSELLEMETMLANARSRNKVKENDLIECRVNLEATKHQLDTEKKSQEQERTQADKSLKCKMKVEKLQRNTLEKHFELMKTNSNIASNELKMIQDTQSMEDEADAILHNAVTNLQKIFRGVRDRVIYKKILKKNRKGKKKQRKGKKKKTN